MKSFVTIVVSCLLCTGFVAESLVAQNPNRFPAPLGIDRMLTGKISKTPKKTRVSNDRSKAAKYVLSTDGETYQLHGHEKELKRFVGKKARVTGTAVGSELTVHSV